MKASGNRAQKVKQVGNWCGGFYNGIAYAKMCIIKPYFDMYRMNCQAFGVLNRFEKF